MGTVTIGSTPQELTTSNAAAILGVSRPTVMKMIADGRLTARKVGTHHRLSSDEVFAHLRARREAERAAFLAPREELDEEWTAFLPRRPLARVREHLQVLSGICLG